MNAPSPYAVKRKANDPIEIRAIISLNEQLARDIATQDECNRTTQNSIKNATWAAFYAVSIYSLITFGMWFQVRKQTGAILKQLEITYGAVVQVERPVVDPPPENGIDPYRVEVHLTNFGKATASDIKGVATISARSIPENHKIQEVVIPFSVENIGPPVESTPAASFGSWIRPLPLSQGTLDMITQGKVAVVVDVLLSYNNGFETIKESVGHCSVFYGFPAVTKRIDNRTTQAAGGWNQQPCGPDEELAIRFKAFDKAHSEALRWENKQQGTENPN